MTDKTAVLDKPEATATKAPKAVPTFVILQDNGDGTYQNVAQKQAGSGRIAVGDFVKESGVTSGNYVPVASSAFISLPVAAETVVRIGKSA